MAAQWKWKESKTSLELNELRIFLIVLGVIKQVLTKCHQDRGSMTSEDLSLLN